MPSEIDEEDLLKIVISVIGVKGRAPAVTLAQLIENMYSSGMSKDAIRTVLLKDLHEGGPLFGGFRKAFTSSFQQGIERSAQLVSHSMYKADLPGDQLYQWIRTKENSCDDCIEREGRDPQTLEEWELEGLPESGVTTCGLNCGCVLLPVDAISKPLDLREPVAS